MVNWSALEISEAAQPQSICSCGVCLSIILARYANLVEEGFTSKEWELGEGRELCDYDTV